MLLEYLPRYLCAAVKEVLLRGGDPVLHVQPGPVHIQEGPHQEKGGVDANMHETNRSVLRGENVVLPEGSCKEPTVDKGPLS